MKGQKTILDILLYVPNLIDDNNYIETDQLTNFANAFIEFY